MGMFKVRVAEVLEETSNIKSFRLKRADGAPFDPYPAGAHIDIVGPTDVVRQYSLCSPPYELDDYVIAVKLEPASRGGSQALHEVAVGQELEISAPRNLMAVAEGADRHILVAAGIGVTPMISMAYHLHRANQEFELHYFARSRDEAAFVDLLETKSGFGERVKFHFGLQRDDQPTVLAAAFAALTHRSHVYTCGPEGFMDRVKDTAASVIPEENVHIEHFQAGEPVDTSADTPFEIEFEDEIYEVPVGRSIVQVLEENGVEVDTTCQEGICGTCIMGVLKGEPDHRDQCMSASEKKANDQIAACVSRSKSPRLVLEMF
ncbi:PDR/VanB family oxidoreductase [Pseudarthrobacter sp. lyk4-40-TYG-27]|uniref:PDR/VanB family oxidoreductase n=1 Tax=Pseudarthrobacter sp. lyk4-40-TYG-27 TaxID=3040305 RepID=UPI0025569C13|nr:PDR/VanB family oxidoreductase [Pseudarthrobacter sp. lyk4-40-TYG-27]